MRIRYRSTIPRQLGLGGSSAIVIATLRALAELAGTTIPRARLPALALAVETDELGIAAGLQDRVVQTYGGLVFMDFATDRYEPLPLRAAAGAVRRLAARTRAAPPAAPTRACATRFDHGDRTIIAAMATLAGSPTTRAPRSRPATTPRSPPRSTPATTSARASSTSTPATRSSSPRARDLGLRATYTGSGGAIVGIARDATPSPSSPTAAPARRARRARRRRPALSAAAQPRPRRAARAAGRSGRRPATRQPTVQISKCRCGAARRAGRADLAERRAGGHRRALGDDRRAAQAVGEEVVAAVGAVEHDVLARAGRLVARAG